MSGAAVASLASLDGVVTANGVAVASSDRIAGRVLPVRAEIATVLPWEGLRRGSTVAIRGSTSLLLALLAEATAYLARQHVHIERQHVHMAVILCGSGPDRSDRGPRGSR